MYLEVLEIAFSPKEYNKSCYMGLTMLWIHICHGKSTICMSAFSLGLLSIRGICCFFFLFEKNRWFFLMGQYLEMNYRVSLVSKNKICNKLCRIYFWLGQEERRDPIPAWLWVRGVSRFAEQRQSLPPDTELAGTGLSRLRLCGITAGRCAGQWKSTWPFRWDKG